MVWGAMAFLCAILGSVLIFASPLIGLVSIVFALLFSVIGAQKRNRERDKA